MLDFSRSSALVGHCDGEAGEEIKINWGELLKTKATQTKFFKQISSKQELLASDKLPMAAACHLQIILT